MMITADRKVVAWNARAAVLLDLPEALLARQPQFEEVQAYQWQMGEFSQTPDGPENRVPHRWPAQSAACL